MVDVEKLLAAIEETERIARAACDERAPATGEHWRWEYAYVHDPRVDQLVDIEACNVYLGDDAGETCANVSLRSVEEYPTRTMVGSLPHFAIMETGGQKVGPARHIARNDPAAVLRRCAQDRLMVEAAQRHTEGHPGEHTNEEDPYDSCELCVEWNETALPERVLDYLARGYGISVGEETTGE